MAYCEPGGAWVKGWAADAHEGSHALDGRAASMDAVHSFWFVDYVVLAQAAAEEDSGEITLEAEKVGIVWTKTREKERKYIRI